MNFRCLRCGVESPRLTVDQVHCPKCAVEVAAVIVADERRRRPRFPFSKDMTGWAA